MTREFNRQELLEIAGYWRNKLDKPIFPVKLEDDNKVPMYKWGGYEWKQYEDKMRDWNVIEEYLDNTQLYSWGTPTGDGIIVVDIDAYKEEDESYADTRQWIEPSPTFQITPKGSIHYFYKVDRFVPDSQSDTARYGHNVDIRGDGGYIRCVGFPDFSLLPSLPEKMAEIIYGKEKENKLDKINNSNKKNYIHNMTPAIMEEILKKLPREDVEEYHNEIRRVVYYFICNKYNTEKYRQAVLNAWGDYSFHKEGDGAYEIDQCFKSINANKERNSDKEQIGYPEFIKMLETYFNQDELDSFGISKKTDILNQYIEYEWDTIIKYRRGEEYIVIDTDSINNFKNIIHIEGFSDNWCWNLSSQQAEEFNKIGFGLEDKMITTLVSAIQRFGSDNGIHIKPTKSDVIMAMELAAKDRKEIDPIKDYFEGLRGKRDDNFSWEEVAEKMCQDSTIPEWVEFCKLLFRGVAVKSITDDYVDFPYIPILYSKHQGKGKTTISQLLGCFKFGKSNLNLNDKSFVEETKGCNVAELGEIDATLFTGAGYKFLQDFATEREKNVRVAYGHKSTKAVNKLVIIGTTNNEKILAKGDNRRFPVMTVDGEMDLDWLEDNLDRIYAECIYEFDNGMFDYNRRGFKYHVIIPEKYWEFFLNVSKQHQSDLEGEENILDMISDLLDKNELYTGKNQYRIPISVLKDKIVFNSEKKNIKEVMSKNGWSESMVRLERGNKTTTRCWVKNIIEVK